MSKFYDLIKEPNLLDLSKKIFNAVLNEDFFVENKSIELSPSLYEAETINFIIADGLGSKNIEKIDSKLNNLNSGSINSTFPSSTNVALSTINLVTEPINTGILSYFQFDKKKYGLINALNWSKENEEMLNEDFFIKNIAKSKPPSIIKKLHLLEEKYRNETNNIKLLYKHIF